MAGKGEDPLWFLGTLTRVVLDGSETGGRLGAFDVVLPRGASPPLHTHPQDETLYVVEGEVTAWVLDPEDPITAGSGDGDPPAWVAERARRCGVGDTIHATGGVPHTFRVESDTARMLTLSTPAGIEAWVRALAEPAEWPWLPPPPDGPRVAPERLEAVNREHGVAFIGPPPPAAADPARP